MGSLSTKCCAYLPMRSRGLLRTSPCSGVSSPRWEREGTGTLDELDERGLADAVGTDDGDARGEVETEVDVAQENAVGTVAEGDALHGENGRGERGTLSERRREDLPRGR